MNKIVILLQRHFMEFQY